MSTTHERVQHILMGHLAPMNARSVLNRALRRSNLSIETLTDQNLSVLLPELKHGIRLFLQLDQQNDVWSQLVTLSGIVELPAPVEIQIKQESDITQARFVARSMCETVGANGLTVQKCATIVSELARNIACYTAGGSLRLAMRDGPPRSLKILALDGGPGIPHLNSVLSGTYKSRTGLGRGLLGVKRLADDFTIQSNINGTRVEAVVSMDSRG